MPRVSNIESFHSDLHPGFQHVHSMDLGETLGSGSFGVVYTCDSINGSSPPLPQVVKILTDNGTDAYRRGFDTIRKLQQKIIESNAQRIAAGRPRLESLPALRALPQFSFLGEMNGHQVLGYSAARLDTEDYVPFAAIVDDPDPELERAYLTLTFDESMLLAAEMAEGFQALSEMSFVHADINAPNLLLDIERCHIAIIDYDSGGVDGDQPTTPGKRDHWVAPEVNGLKDKIDHLADRWSVFVGIHYLLFLYPPLFFLNTYMTSDSAGIYLRDCQWPNIPSNHSLFDPGVTSAYNQYLLNFGELPEGVKRELSSTLNEGFLNPLARTSCQQWASTLRAAIRGLKILSFKASPGSVVASIPTLLSWSVSDAYEVSLDNGIGVVVSVASEGSREVYPTQTCVYTLTARTRHGVSVSQRLTVFVWPFPELRSIQIPTCSVEQRFSLSVLLSPLPDINLPINVDVGIHISQPFFRPRATAEIESARARMPKSFPGLQRNGKKPLLVIFNQLKARIIELAGAT
jgi:serine/threonine protein kinase